MESAIAQAREDALTAGDVPVGAVIVSSRGRVLAKAANRVERDGDPTAHAEVLAIRGAARVCGSPQLLDSILVVTLEPCLMCLGAVAHARLMGVVFGAYDARAGVLASCADLVDLPVGGVSLWYCGGVLAAPCAALLREFFQHRR